MLQGLFHNRGKALGIGSWISAHKYFVNVVFLQFKNDENQLTLKVPADTIGPFVFPCVMILGESRLKQDGRSGAR